MGNRFVKATCKDTIGSSFTGYLVGPYHELVHKLGRPHDCTQKGEWLSVDGKVRTEWVFRTTARRRRAVITIYDYKEVQPVQNVVLWHIGLKGEKSRIDEFLKSKGLAIPRR